MRKAMVFVSAVPAGILIELDGRKGYIFEYLADYHGDPVSLTMPPAVRRYEFGGFPPFFDGVLPEGPQLEALLRSLKLDRDDFFGQLAAVGRDLVGAVTVSLMDDGMEKNGALAGGETHV
jgi:serine/threonine-protein kinase HipA